MFLSLGSGYTTGLSSFERVFLTLLSHSEATYLTLPFPAIAFGVLLYASMFPALDKRLQVASFLAYDRAPFRTFCRPW